MTFLAFKMKLFTLHLLNHYTNLTHDDWEWRYLYWTNQFSSTLEEAFACSGETVALVLLKVLQMIVTTAFLASLHGRFLQCTVLLKNTSCHFLPWMWECLEFSMWSSIGEISAAVTSNNKIERHLVCRMGFNEIKSMILDLRVRLVRSSFQGSTDTIRIRSSLSLPWFKLIHEKSGQPTFIWQRITPNMNSFLYWLAAWSVNIYNEF